jgi:hypothetical protein
MEGLLRAHFGNTGGQEMFDHHGRITDSDAEHDVKSCPPLGGCWAWSTRIHAPHRDKVRLCQYIPDISTPKLPVSRTKTTAFRNSDDTPLVSGASFATP